MLNLYPVPIDAIAWCIGATVLWIFTLKCYLNYRVTRNPLLPKYMMIASTLGASCLLFGLPSLLTHDNHTLFYTNYIGDVFVQICMMGQIWLAWFIGWKKFVPLWVVLVPTIVFSCVILFFEYHTSSVYWSSSPYVVVYNDAKSILWMKSILYILISWPLGYFFIRLGLAQQSRLARIKSIMTGLMFIFISGAAIYTNLFNHGSDNFNSAVQNFIVFSVFLLITIWPRKRQAALANQPTLH